MSTLRKQMDLAAEEPQDSAPTDLSQWAGKRTLVSLTLTVIQTVDDRRVDRAIPPFESPFLPPRMMLTLLTYCYAVGLYGSAEIEQHIARDDTLRYLCARHGPPADFIRRFRNRNREILAACLSQVCLAACCKKQSANSPSNLLSHRRDQLQEAWRSRLFRLQCLCDARERLRSAERADGSALDAQ